MDRVIPKDIIDLIYKESHLDKMKRLNAEYYERFEITHSTIFDRDYGDSRSTVRLKINQFGFCYRSLVDTGYHIIWAVRNNKAINVADLPKRYFYSSGHFKLKWIE